MKFTDFFPKPKKAIGAIILTMLGVLAWKAANKAFNIESRLPRSKMK